MATISFNQWGFGLDLRKGPSTSDANRLRALKNAYVTDGKTIRKRNGATKQVTLQLGTVGLFAGLGRLNTFQIQYNPGDPIVSHGSALVVNNALTANSGSDNIAEVVYCDTFNGYLYVVALHSDNGSGVPGYQHHYLDGSADTRITDVNCPKTAIAAKAASKMWAGNGDTVRFCKTNDPRDWTTANDAGFLPVGLQQTGSRTVTAIGNYQNRLVPFFVDSAQVWQVDPDPVNHQFLQSVDIGTRRPYAHANMHGDIFYFSPAGVRSITKQADTENLIDVDIGSPIDQALIRGDIFPLVPPGSVDETKASYFRGAGQYWLYAGTKALVFTFSRTAKISAWSEYVFSGMSLDYVAELDGDLYIRSGSADVYKMDRTAWTDDGNLYEVEIETPFVDFQSPGVIKQIYALDAVMTGSGEISHRFDPRNPSLETDPPVTISGDTRPGTLYPVELMTTNLSTVVRNENDQEFELHAISYQYENLVGYA